MTQYQKDGKIFEITPSDDINQVNEFSVICEACNKPQEAGNAHATGGNSKTGELSNWLCKKCEDESEATYQASCMDVDFHQSELAESEY
jgi:hypothetical protein